MGLIPFVVVRQYEKAAVERWGKLFNILDPGLHLVIPLLDRVAFRVDMRERVIDVPPQPVITRDNVAVAVDAIIYCYVTDPRAVLYEVVNFQVAVVKLAQTNLRNLVGDMTLDETLTSRDKINTALRETLDEATDKWGVKVTRVEVMEINPPGDITEAMSKQMKAEREKRATILEAEAYKQKQILEAEGDRENAIRTAEGQKQSAILVAEGDRQAAILVAEGEAKAIETVSTAASSYFKDNAQTLKKLEVTEASLKQNAKIVVPAGSQLINIIGDLIGERVPPSSPVSE